MIFTAAIGCIKDAGRIINAAGDCPMVHKACGILYKSAMNFIKADKACTKSYKADKYFIIGANTCINAYKPIIEPANSS